MTDCEITDALMCNQAQKSEVTDAENVLMQSMIANGAHHTFHVNIVHSALLHRLLLTCEYSSDSTGALYLRRSATTGYCRMRLQSAGTVAHHLYQGVPP